MIARCGSLFGLHPLGVVRQNLSPALPTLVNVAGYAAHERDAADVEGDG
jgi:hypothetical protein